MSNCYTIVNFDLGFVEGQELLGSDTDVKERGNMGMLWVIIAVAAYLLLQIVILPYFGFST